MYMVASKWLYVLPEDSHEKFTDSNEKDVFDTTSSTSLRVYH